MPIANVHFGDGSILIEYYVDQFTAFQNEWCTIYENVKLSEAEGRQIRDIYYATREKLINL